jgi:DNA-binding NarL/FixJ family response regulator
VLCDSFGAALSTGELLLEVRRNLPAVSIVMFGMDTDQDKFLTAIHYAVTGYVFKDASAADVAGAIRAVFNGESVCPPTLCRALFDHAAASEAWRPGVQVRQNLGLTPKRAAIGAIAQLRPHEQGNCCYAQSLRANS